MATMITAQDGQPDMMNLAGLTDIYRQC